MSFEAVWGFDPDRAIQAVGLPPSEIETDKFTYSAERTSVTTAASVEGR